MQVNKRERERETQNPQKEAQSHQVILSFSKVYADADPLPFHPPSPSQPSFILRVAFYSLCWNKDFTQGSVGCFCLPVYHHHYPLLPPMTATVLTQDPNT